jgi:hypothetical protein
MPLNLTKRYPLLLELAGMSEKGRARSLRLIFDRDIADNDQFSFRSKKIYPIKTDGQIDMDREFLHLTTNEESGEDGVSQRTYDRFRSERLHWIRTHIEEKTGGDIIVFSIKERNPKKRVDETRVYIYNKGQKYIIVLEPQRKGQAYFLLTAYYLNKEYGEEQIKKKMKRGIIL